MHNEFLRKGAQEGEIVEQVGSDASRSHGILDALGGPNPPFDDI
jgi:hypothetical protein